jgi:glyoxylase-like metal-dependent hydrolase (beta-lactamase superfamily II)
MLVLTKSDLLFTADGLFHQHNGVWWRFIVQSTGMDMWKALVMMMDKKKGGVLKEVVLHTVS